MDKNELLALIATNLPDNNAAEITPALVRDTLNQMVASDANLEELSEQEFQGFVAGVTPLNLRTINSEAAFPAPVGGVITLEGNTVYEIGTQIITENRFVVGDGTVITSNNIFGPALVYTGTGAMFTGSEANFALDRVAVACPNGMAFNFTSASGSQAFGLNLAVISSCASAGIIDGYRSFNITNSSFFNADQGFSINGSNWVAFSIIRMSMTTTSASFIGIDLGTSLLKSTEINNLVVNGIAGSVGVNGATDSQNISPGVIASFSQCEFPSPITPLTGISKDDFRYSFLGNSDIMDSTVDANPYLVTPTTVSIATAGTYVKINQGNWSFTTATRLTVTADGDIINNLEGAIKVQITGTVTLEKTGGGSDLITARLVYNDDPANAQSVITEIGTNNTEPTNIALTGIFTLEPNDSLSIWVANQDSTSNIVVDYAKFALLRVL